VRKSKNNRSGIVDLSGGVMQWPEGWGRGGGARENVEEERIDGGRNNQLLQVAAASEREITQRSEE